MLRYFFIGLLSLTINQKGLSASTEEIKPIVEVGRVHKLPHADISIRSHMSDDIQGLTIFSGKEPKFGNCGEIVFFIEKEGQKIGDVVFLLWPKRRGQEGPILKLQAILIGKSHHAPTAEDLENRRKGYGTQALETIWTVLRKKDTGVHLPVGTAVTLDIERDKPWLIPWYEKFGFVLQPDTMTEFLKMQAPLKSTKFPLFQKIKAEKEAQEAASALKKLERVDSE